MDERHHIGGSDFVWDVDKADANWQKHRIRFEDAATVFADPLFVLVDASRNSSLGCLTISASAASSAMIASSGSTSAIAVVADSRRVQDCS